MLHAKTKLDPVTLTPDNSNKNALEQFKQSGYYTAAELGEKIFANDYCHNDSLSETNTLTDAQITFIESRDKQSKAAFYIDGIWWEHENRIKNVERVTTLNIFLTIFK